MSEAQLNVALTTIEEILDTIAIVNRNDSSTEVVGTKQIINLNINDANIDPVITKNLP